MDSINKNQEEKNHENLTGDNAVKKIRELVNTAETCFLSTQPSSSDSNGTRPMTVQEVDEEGNLLFLSAADSYTNQDIENDAAVKLYFQGSKRSDFLYIEGTASISQDRAKIRALWEPIYKTWFTEGEDDPRISVITVSPSSGYYWDNKHGNIIATLKILAGAVTGKTTDDSIEGHLKP